jgi:hypothetical protein
MQTRRFVTEIWPVDGPRLVIASSSWKSIVEQEGRDQAYGAFIRELHRRIAASGARVTFEAGSPPILYWLGLAVFVIVTLGLAVLTVRRQSGAWAAAAIIGGMPACSYGRAAIISPQPSGQLSPGGAAGAASPTWLSCAGSRRRADRSA